MVTPFRLVPDPCTCRPRRDRAHERGCPRYIGLPAAQARFACTRCGASFDERTELQRHFDTNCDDEEGD